MTKHNRCSLPKLTHSPEQCCECVPYLETDLTRSRAKLKIAVEALKAREHCLACQTHEHPLTKEALRRIAELGGESGMPIEELGNVKPRKSDEPFDGDPNPYDL